jgi:hypothetical protein
MRIWSLHPQYLDSKGLVALWRETLLARKVLEGKTKGYRQHPQLQRFRQAQQPVNALNAYLIAVFEEAAKRGYAFSRDKLPREMFAEQMTVTTGQLQFEKKHLLAKLAVRDPQRMQLLRQLKQAPDPHPLFTVVNGSIESWERT